MKSYINKTTLMSAVATVAGIFIYKKYISSKVKGAVTNG